MTHHLGIFIPQHGHNFGWGLTELNQLQAGSALHPGSAWNLAGQWNHGNAWHAGSPLHPGSAWNLAGQWNPASAWQAGSTLHPGSAWNLGSQWNHGNAWHGGTTGHTGSTWGQGGNLNPGAFWYGNAGLNLNGLWNQNPGQTPIWLSPNYGTNNHEIGHGTPTQTSQIAFIPHQGGLTGGSYGPAGTTGGSFYTPWHSGHHVTGGIGHSFATELAENNHEYVISFDVPGINIEDLDVSLAGSTILINGIRKGPNESLAYSEIARGNLSRAIGVPFEVTPNKAINTSLENGVLKIRISKEGQSEKKVGSRKVKIG